MFARNRESQMTSLREVSARIGSDPLLVQASTGNTSMKLGRTLSIKASGKWLAHARHEEQFVPVDLVRARNCLRQNIDVAAAYMSSAGKQLKPSVETAMHSVIPDRVVLHVHSVSTIAWAVRKDGSAQVKDRLAGLRWRWIDYMPSGKELASEIEKALAQARRSQVFILANHGLVVSGESAEAAEALLFEVEKRLKLHPRPAAPPDPVELARLSSGSRWQVPDSMDLHALATDAVSRHIISGGILYPCQAIFFGLHVPAEYTVASFEAGNSSWSRMTPPPLFAMIQSAGVLISRSMTKTEHAMLAGLVQVVRRVDRPSGIAYLTQRDVKRVLTVAHQYRAGMDRQGSQLRGDLSGSKPPG
jgi:rhamnose utilization protein RhaD (predicted bifunctional aldolase and dehydrogenase)